MGYHPLDLDLRIDPVALPLDQSAELKERKKLDLAAENSMAPCGVWGEAPHSPLAGVHMAEPSGHPLHHHGIGADGSV
jgi:hypothetical protein